MINMEFEPLKEEIKDYLNGTQTLSQFYIWFMEETWDIEDWASKELQDIVNSLKLSIYDYQHHINHIPNAEEILKKEIMRKILNCS